MYVINRKGRDGRVFWRCHKSRQCSGGLTTLDNTAVSTRSTHNHPADPAEVKAHKIKAKLKNIAKETVQPLPTLYSQEVSQACVPPRFVHTGWQALKANAPTLSVIPQFIDYFENIWLVGNFDIRLLNVHDSSTIHTNNHVEGWHSRLNKIVGKAIPNMFELVDMTKKEQATTEVDVTQWAVRQPHQGGAGRLLIEKEKYRN